MVRLSLHIEILIQKTGAHILSQMNKLHNLIVSHFIVVYFWKKYNIILYKVIELKIAKLVWNIISIMHKLELQYFERKVKLRVVQN